MAQILGVVQQSEEPDWYDARMPSPSSPSVDERKATLAAEAWAPLIDFIVATGPRRSRVFGELGLTPNDGRALGSLDPKIGRSMRSLADEWGCDASTATWAIDRLVAKGLAERLDPCDSQPRLALDRLSCDVALARDGRIDAVEKAQMLPQAPGQANDIDRRGRRSIDVLDDEPEIQLAESARDPADDFRVGVGNSQDPLAVAAFGVEDAGEEARVPFAPRRARP